MWFSNKCPSINYQEMYELYPETRIDPAAYYIDISRFPELIDYIENEHGMSYFIEMDGSKRIYAYLGNLCGLRKSIWRKHKICLSIHRFKPMKFSDYNYF